jgi:hypothetical protein
MERRASRRAGARYVTPAPPLGLHSTDFEHDGDIPRVQAGKRAGGQAACGPALARGRLDGLFTR